jgi:hypothetical protein
MSKAVLQSMTLSKKKVMDFTNVTNLQRGNMLRRNVKAIRHFQRDRRKLRRQSETYVCYSDEGVEKAETLIQLD